MTQPPFGDEERRDAIDNYYNRNGGGGPAARGDINFLLRAIAHRDAAIADPSVSLAAERARHKVPIDVLAPLRKPPEAPDV